MALMQQYRGKEEDFDPAKMKPGQFAVSLDKKYIRMCFDPGLVERIALYDAFEEDMLQIQQILATCENIQTAVKEFEYLAEKHTTQAEIYSFQSKSWAVGGTGTRQGEDTDNSKYYAQQAKEAADRAESVTDIGIATSQKAGIVKPDNKTIRADSAGTLSTLNWATGNPSTVLNKWCKIASVTLLTTRFEDFTAVILAQELEMMYGAALIHWNCNTESYNIGVDQMKTPCRMTALCGNGRTMSEYFEKCFFTECVQADETHVTYNLWYEPKLAYLRYTFSLLGANANYDKDYQIYTNPEYVTEPLTGRIIYPEKNSWPFLTANLLATVPGTALDATMGNLLNDMIAVNTKKLEEMQELCSSGECISISAITELDNYKRDGIYTIMYTGTHNAPIYGGGLYILEVRSQTFTARQNGVYQRLTRIYPNTSELNSTYGVELLRTYYNTGKWGKWLVTV